MSVPSLIPVRTAGAAFDAQASSLPAGTNTVYGLTTWVPDGYPQGSPRPYLTADGRIVLRPLMVTPVPPGMTADQRNAYILAALQAAVNKYSGQPITWRTTSRVQLTG